MTLKLTDHDFSSAVRTIPAKERGNRGVFPSKKVKNGVVEYESQIERDFFILLEHDDHVAQYQHQPIKIPYGDNQSYTPDVHVRFTNGLEILVEIKDDDTYQQSSEKFKERWDACKEFAEDSGMSFIVLTEIDIRSARMSNIWFTLGSAKVTSNDRYMDKIRNIFPKDGLDYKSACYRIAELLGININKASQILCYAIYHGYVFVDTFSDKPISNTTIIRRKTKDIFPFTPIWIELDEALQMRDEEEIFSIEISSVKEINSETVVEQNQRTSKKERIVKAFQKTPSYKRSKEWRAQFESKHDVSISSVYNWVKKYEEEGKIGLKDKYSKSGRNKTWDGYTLEILEKGRKAFLKPNFSVKKAYEEIVEASWDIDDDPPSYSSFWRFIKENTSYHEVEVAKKGRKRKRDLEPALKSFQGAIMPMQVLQFDNTPFDLFIQDEEVKKSIGTPNLCAAIDVYSRMITGFELSLNSINRQSVLETLVQSILPKDRFVSNIFKEGDYYPYWDIQGFPVLILVDNGMDYRSQDVRRFCVEYDIILEFAPIRKPRYKAYIENWFNILKEAIAFELSEDGFRPNIRKRLENPDFDPEANVIFTYQQTELWLSSWILDEYHLNNTYNDGLPAPSIRMDNYEMGNGSIILPQARDPPTKKSDVTLIQVNALVTTTRVLKDNIEFSNLNYSSSELITLYNQKGRIKLTILYDMRDIRVIWALHPETKKPIELELTYGWANTFVEVYGHAPIALSFWKKEIALIRERNRQRISLALFRKEKGKEYRSQLRKRARETKKSKRKRRDIETQKENQMKLSRKSISPSPLKDKKADDLQVGAKPKSKRSRVKTIRIPKNEDNPFAGKKRKKGGK